MQRVPPDEELPEKLFRYDHQSGRHIAATRTKPFLKGPIPLDWLDAAAALPGKALHVALAIWWLAGMQQGSNPVKITRSALSRFHVCDDAANDALKRLEAAGLISVSRRPGCRHEVRILKYPLE